jgi:hypothetical protein
VAVQRSAVTLENGLLLRFHLLTPDTQGVCRQWHIENIWPFLSGYAKDLHFSIGLPETPAISSFAHVLSPFWPKLNLLRNSIHNMIEAFGCWRSLF